MNPKNPSERARISLGPALLNRGWVILVTAAIVGAVGYGVGSFQSTSYTADAVLAVSSSGPSGPGNADQARQLARSYAGALPSDEKLLRILRQRSGRRSVGTLQAASGLESAVLKLSFTSTDQKAAIRGARAAANVLTANKPVTETVGPGSLTVVRRAGKARQLPDGRWRATSILVVPAGSGAGSTLAADQANKQAKSYAGLIPVDDRVIGRTARATGLTTDEVLSDLTVVNQSQTSLLQVRFRADTSKQAITGARSVADLVSGVRPAAPAIVPSSLQVVSLPRVNAASASSSSTPIVIGAVVGALLGMVLLVAWERANPHIHETVELSRQLGAPATRVDRLSLEAANALMERWSEMAQRSPSRIVLIPVNGTADAAAEQAFQLFLSGGSDVRGTDARAGEGRIVGSDSRTPQNVLVLADAPGIQGVGEAAALEADITVLVVRDGITAKGLREAADDLRGFGVAPDWALLVSRRGLALPDQAQSDAVTA